MNNTPQEVHFSRPTNISSQLSMESFANSLDDGSNNLSKLLSTYRAANQQSQCTSNQAPPSSRNQPSSENTVKYLNVNQSNSSTTIATIRNLLANNNTNINKRNNIPFIADDSFLKSLSVEQYDELSQKGKNSVPCNIKIIPDCNGVIDFTCPIPDYDLFSLLATEN
jgi:hypothetical protein